MILAEEPPPVTHVAVFVIPDILPSVFGVLCGAFSDVSISEDDLSHKTAIEMEAMNICIPCLRLALRSRP